MKILVTGAGGFLGKAIVERLLAHGQTDVRCMLRDTSKARGLEAIAARYPQAKLEFVTANLRNLVEIAPAVADCEMVIHAAASLKGSPAEMFMDSVVASRNLLESVVNELRPIRMVLVSSFGVMGVAELPRGAMIDESTPLERHPEQRDVYSHSKWRQEQLFWDYRAKYGFELVVLRPGVIYGPGGGGHFSNRVGLNLFGRFLHLGGNNLLPLTYVDNCAEAIVVAALSGSDGEVYNVVDDDLVTSKQYLAAYNKQVRKVRSVPVPYFALMWGSKVVERYSAKSKGQLPAIFTPYKTRAMWGGNQFSNAKLKSIGWRPLISTREGMERAFAAFRAEPEKAK